MIGAEDSVALIGADVIVGDALAGIGIVVGATAMGDDEITGAALSAIG